MPAFRPAGLLVFLLLAAALAAGCRSPEELYADGQRLELDGRHAAAAFRYADALAKNPSLQKARGRLGVAGALALADYLNDAARALDQDRLADGADRYLDADHLLGRAAAVGVPLERPPDYAAARRATLDAALDAAPGDARRLARSGLFGDALAALDRARRYADGTRAIEGLTTARVDVLGLWAETDLSMGRFRAAFDRAGSGLALLDGLPLPAADALAASLLRVQEDALARGTIRAAAFPVEAADAVLPTRGPLAGFDRDLTDRLFDGPLAAPPPFVRFAAPPAVRAALRELQGSERRFGRPGTSAELARMLDARYAAAFRLDSLAIAGVPTGPRVPGAEPDEEAEVRLSGVLAYAVTDARTARVVCDGAVQHEERERIRRRDAADAQRAAALRLQDALSETAAERIAACLVARVP